MVVVINSRQRSATVYRSPTDIIALAEADILAGGDVVPAFKLAVGELFAQPHERSFSVSRPIQES